MVRLIGPLGSVVCVPAEKAERLLALGYRRPAEPKRDRSVRKPK